MTSNVIVRTVTFFGLACVALDPQNARAHEQRISPSICQIQPFSQGYHDISGRAMNSQGAGPGVFHCPLQDNSDHNYTTAQHVFVSVQDNGRPNPPEFTQAQLCLTPDHIDGAYCGPIYTTSVHGWQEVQVVTDYWWNTPDPPDTGFPYVRVVLPYWGGTGNGAASKLAGIRVVYP
jgi:hypothetical protein